MAFCPGRLQSSLTSCLLTRTAEQAVKMATSIPNAFQRATETTAHLRALLPAELKYPKVAIVCGSGLGGLAETIDDEPKTEIQYKDVPNFAQSTGT